MATRRAQGDETTELLRALLIVQLALAGGPHRESREGVASPAALVMWARDLGIGVASALDKLPAHLQQQLSVPRVVAPRPVRAASLGAGGARSRKPARRRPARGSTGKWVFISHAG